MFRRRLSSFLVKIRSSQSLLALIPQQSFSSRLSIIYPAYAWLRVECVRCCDSSVKALLNIFYNIAVSWNLQMRMSETWEMLKISRAFHKFAVNLGYSFHNSLPMAIVSKSWWPAKDEGKSGHEYRFNSTGLKVPLSNMHLHDHFFSFSLYSLFISFLSIAIQVRLSVHAFNWIELTSLSSRRNLLLLQSRHAGHLT
jgi:hypothetical protein